MDTNFKLPDGFRLEFIQYILDNPDLIQIYQGNNSPSIVIDPLDCPDDLRLYYYDLGFTSLFDIVPI